MLPEKKKEKKTDTYSFYNTIKSDTYFLKKSWSWKIKHNPEHQQHTGF